MTTTTTTNPATIVVRRTIAASAEELFDAWLDPESAAEIMRPGGGAKADVTIDARVGGAFSIVMHGATKDHPHRGTYRIIERPRRLVFTWFSESTDEKESVVTIEFKAGERGTEVILTHAQLPEVAREGHIKGWTDILVWLEKRAG
jgi:uncharacterized protein YndB with AHSA1/START domain